MSSQSKSSGLGLPTVLFLIFLVLKLTDHIDRSWWWVTSPLWLPLVFIVIMAVIVATVREVNKR